MFICPYYLIPVLFLDISSFDDARRNRIIRMDRSSNRAVNIQLHRNTLRANIRKKKEISLSIYLSADNDEISDTVEEDKQHENQSPPRSNDTVRHAE